MNLRTAMMCLLNILAAAVVVGDDWPQWNGPTRDGVLRERNIVATIPRDGLPKLWDASIHLGYSGPAIVGSRVVVTDYEHRSGRAFNNPGRRDRLQGTERVLCFDAARGDLIWKHEYNRPYAVSYGSGPRATPTIHGGLVFSVGAEGNLNCFRLEDGQLLWQKDYRQDFGAETPFWGHSAAPLIYENLLICLVGGEGSLVVAFDYRTGQEVWRNLSSAQIGYCPPTIVRAGGAEQLMIWDPERLHSLNPDTGEEYWQVPLKPGYNMSVLPPVVDGDLMFVSGESSVSVMLRLDSDRPAAEIVWTGKPKTSVYLATAGAIFEDGHLYGSDSRTGALLCARASDGQRLWQTAQPTSGGDRPRGGSNGSAYLIRSPHGYLILSDTGDMISAELTPRGYRETGRFAAIEPTEKIGSRTVVWTFPAVSDGRLFLRSGPHLVCYDIRARRR